MPRSRCQLLGAEGFGGGGEGDTLLVERGNGE